MIERNSSGHEMERGWRDWLPVWVLWALGTTFGWVVAWMVGAGLAMATFWDPDEVEAYLRSPLAYVLTRAVLGAILGAMIGAVIGLVRWFVLRRSARDVVFAVGITILGVTLLCATSAIGPGQIESDLSIDLRSGAVGGAIGGLFGGLWQWLILRRRASRVDGWILLTVAGWAIVWAITFATSSAYQRQVAPQILSLAAVLTAGALVGLGRWLVLRHNVMRAGWWILATALSWGLAYWLAVSESTTALAIVGVITGAALVWSPSRSAA